MQPTQNELASIGLRQPDIAESPWGIIRGHESGVFFDSLEMGGMRAQPAGKVQSAAGKRDRITNLDRGIDERNKILKAVNGSGPLNTLP